MRLPTRSSKQCDERLLDRRLLEEGLGVAAELLGRRIDGWTVEFCEHRPNSSVVRLGLLAGDQPAAVAYYKIGRVPADKDAAAAANRRAQTHHRLTMGRRLDEQFHELARGRPLQVPRTLATDPDRGVELALAVPGRALGRGLQLMALRDTDRAVALWRLLGEAVAVVEGCESDQAPPLKHDLDIARAVGRLERLIGPRERQRLVAMGEELRDAAERECLQVLCHGDLSGSHVFHGDAGLALIDLSWGRMWRAYDLTTLAVWLDYGLFVPRRTNRPLIAAAVDGYGDPAVVDSPAWRFLRLWQVVSIAKREVRGLRGRTRRALARRELLATVGARR